MNQSRVTVQQLRCLVAVADALHFGQAAAECDISQPGLSAQIANLETVLGTRLVERTTRRVLLTEAGQRVAERARRISNELEAMVQDASVAAEPLSGPLHLGVIPTIAPYFLPPLLPGVRETFGDLKLFLREDQTAKLLELLGRGHIDVALMALPSGVDGLDEVKVVDEPFWLAAPNQAPWTQIDEVHQSDLVGHEVLLLEDGHCLRSQALAVCSRLGASESTTIRATSITTLVQMVANGLGVTLLPESAVRSELAHLREVRAIPFANPVPSRQVGLVARRTAGRMADMQMLAQLFSAGYAGEGRPMPIVKSITSSDE